jgi:hypothetical protein
MGGSSRIITQLTKGENPGDFNCYMVEASVYMFQPISTEFIPFRQFLNRMMNGIIYMGVVVTQFVAPRAASLCSSHHNTTK